jgi:methylated-DNA-[protein]-cysteine S-methyltransferase
LRKLLVPEPSFQARIRTPFTTIGIRASDTHVTAIRYLSPSEPALAPKKDTIAFLACVEIQSYLENGKFRFALPLALSGTRHQLAVWEAMQRIPAGKTRTYGELAQEIGSSPRAVGAACGSNPVPIVVPCHRVIAAGGRIGGFMGARTEGFELSIKRWLLEHEGAF